MFGGCQSAIFTHSANKLAYKLRDTLRIFPEGPRVDDGIAGIVVYIRVGSIDPMNADGACFERGDFAHGVGVFKISASGERHAVGKEVPSSKRIAVPRSKSAPIRSGSFDFVWS